MDAKTAGEIVGKYWPDATWEHVKSAAMCTRIAHIANSEGISIEQIEARFGQFVLTPKGDRTTPKTYEIIDEVFSIVRQRRAAQRAERSQQEDPRPERPSPISVLTSECLAAVRVLDDETRDELRVKAIGQMPAWDRQRYELVDLLDEHENLAIAARARRLAVKMCNLLDGGTRYQQYERMTRQALQGE